MKYLILIAAFSATVSFSSYSLAGDSKQKLEKTDTKNDKTEME